MAGERLLAVRRFCLDATFTATQVVFSVQFKEALGCNEYLLVEDKQKVDIDASTLPITHLKYDSERYFISFIKIHNPSVNFE